MATEEKKGTLKAKMEKLSEEQLKDATESDFNRSDWHAEQHRNLIIEAVDELAARVETLEAGRQPDAMAGRGLAGCTEMEALRYAEAEVEKCEHALRKATDFWLTVRRGLGIRPCP